MLGDRQCAGQWKERGSASHVLQKLDCVNRTENGSSGKNNTWQEVRGALKLMEMSSASEKSEQGADSRTRELRKGFLEEVASPSDLPNRLI